MFISKSISISLWKLPRYVLLLCLISACTQQDSKSKPLPRPVKVFRIQEKTESVTTTFAGEVRPRWETTLSFRVPGKIIARSIEVSDRVRKGQRLVKLDASDYQLAEQGLKSQLKSAQAERDFARDDLIRYRELLDQRVISLPEFDRHKTAYTTAQERVVTLDAQLRQTSNQLSYTDLLADRDGVVTALEVEAGQVVIAGQAIVKLARLDEKEIEFDVPEHRIREVKLDQAITVSLWSSETTSFQAKIREIAATANPDSRTYRVKATLLEGLDSARLGMTATVWLAANLSTTIAVPLSAIFTPQNEPRQPRVWVIDETANAVKSIPIQIGIAQEGEKIGVTGLAVGQLIVSAGGQRLTEGQVVRLLEKSTTTNQGHQS